MGARAPGVHRFGEGGLRDALGGQLAPGAVAGELLGEGAGAFVVAVDLDQEQRHVGAGIAQHQVGEQRTAPGHSVLDLGGERLQVPDPRLREQASGGGDVQGVLGVRRGATVPLGAQRRNPGARRQGAGGFAAASAGQAPQLAAVRQAQFIADSSGGLQVDPGLPGGPVHLLVVQDQALLCSSHPLTLPVNYCCQSPPDPARTNLAGIQL
ncbi:hypothetical protein [Kitasatospora fiedleri]|uniref:hypothetical protein n=1 Tax=Kitasatospora fiedleri TaxID=2991545 RepID=UPI00249C7EF7|nr:hypothetical protein [Kitasatospora fiedleri]